MLGIFTDVPVAGAGAGGQLAAQLALLLGPAIASANFTHFTAPRTQPAASTGGGPGIASAGLLAWLPSGYTARTFLSSLYFSITFLIV